MQTVIWFTFATSAALLFSTLIFFKKIPYGKAMILRGPLRKKDGFDHTIARGRSVFVFPGLDEFHYLSLNVSTKEIVLDKIPVMDPVPDQTINIKAVTQFRISPFDERLHNAVEHLLGKSKDEVERIAMEVIEKALWETISNKTIYDVNENRFEAGEEASRLADIELSSLGLEIRALVIKEIDDDYGFLDTLGRGRTMDVILRTGVSLPFIREPSRTILTRENEQSDHTAERYFKMGLWHLENGNPRSALVCFEGSFHYDPDNGDYHRKYREAFYSTVQDFRDEGYHVFCVDEYGFVILDPEQVFAGDDLKPSDYDSYSMDRKGAFLLALESSIYERQGRYLDIADQFKKRAEELDPRAFEDVFKFYNEQGIVIDN